MLKLIWDFSNWVYCTSTLMIQPEHLIRNKFYKPSSYYAHSKQKTFFFFFFPWLPENLQQGKEYLLSTLSWNDHFSSEGGTMLHSGVFIVVHLIALLRYVMWEQCFALQQPLLSDYNTAMITRSVSLSLHKMESCC